MPEKVLVTREIPEAGLRILEPFDVTVLHERPPERDELLDAVRGVSGVLSTATENMDGEVMDAAGEGLRVIANMAVGYDNVDVEAAGERGVVVTNTPGVLDETTADVAFMLLLAAARRLGEGERLLRAGRVGVVGAQTAHGPRRVGQERSASSGSAGSGRPSPAAPGASGWRSSTTTAPAKRRRSSELGASYMDLDDLLQTADFVSIHTPLTPETTHLIGADELDNMKPEAVLVNTSRGPVVDEAALADALAERRIFAAGLDVYENEPEVHPKLLELENVVLAPHIGSASIETRDKMAALAAENLAAVLRGESPKTPVNE